MQRRRLLWLSHLLPWPPKGGVMQRSFHLMREVARYHDIALVALRQRAHQPDEDARQAAITALREFVDVLHVSDLPQDHFPGGQSGLALRSLLPGPPFTIRWAHSKPFQQAVAQALRDTAPEAVHFDTISLAPCLDPVRGTPTLLNHHNIESHMLLRRAQQQSNPVARLYFHQEGQRLLRYEQAACPRFSHHITCSDLDGERLRAQVPGISTTVIPNGVDLGYFQPPPPTQLRRPDSLVFVGRMSWYPNLDAMDYFLREIWPLVRRSRPNATLDIAGKLPRALPESFKAAPGVTLHGFVDDIRPLVHSSQVYVCPIRDGGGTKLKMLDAMAMGIPIVAHPVACEGLGIVHGKHALVTEVAADFTHHIISLLDDADSRSALALAAWSHVSEQFSFAGAGLRLAGLANSLCADRGAGLTSTSQRFHQQPH